MQKITSYVAMLAIACSVFLASTASSQEVKRIVRSGGATGAEGMTTIEENNIFLLPEAQAVLREENGAIHVVDIMDEPSPGSKSGATSSEKVDVQEGDILLMANGKRLSTIGDLRALYEQGATGSAFKLGIKRDGENRIVSFTKADAKDLPKVKRMVITSGGDSEKEIMPLAGSGILVENKGSAVVVTDVLPHAKKIVKGEAKAGDVITSINGTAVSSFKQARTLLEKIAVGENVRIEAARGDKKVALSFTRPDKTGERVIIKR